MAFFQLGNPWGYQSANQAKSLWASQTAPSAPGIGEVWLDISISPAKLKRYNGTGWDIISYPTAAEVLTLIKTVDGVGSGLDAARINGYRFESGTVLAPFRTDAPVLVSFSATFTTVPVVVVGGGPDTTAGTVSYGTTKTLSLSGFTLVQPMSGTYRISWIAIGV